MGYYDPELGSGQVEYTPTRTLIHFGSAKADIEKHNAEQRLRKAGFLLRGEEPSE